MDGVGLAPSVQLILPANDGHPVKRVHYATEVNHDKTKSSKATARKRYSKEFKDEALALAERLGVPAAAKELGLRIAAL